MALSTSIMPRLWSSRGCRESDRRSQPGLSRIAKRGEHLRRFRQWIVFRESARRFCRAWEGWSQHREVVLTSSAWPSDAIPEPYFYGYLGTQWQPRLRVATGLVKSCFGKAWSRESNSRRLLRSRRTQSIALDTYW